MGQGAHVEGALAPTAALNVPAGQLTQEALGEAAVLLDQKPAGHNAPAVQEVAPWALKLPGAQKAQVVLDSAPTTLDHVPAGQGVGELEPAGQ